MADDDRRAALKALVPLTHQAAAEYSRHAASAPPPIAERYRAIAKEIRVFADRIDEVATTGSATVLAAFFGALH